jgi:hypothetical protein
MKKLILTILLVLSFLSPARGSITFDGVDDIVNCGSSASLDNLTTMTISTWVNPDSDGGPGKILTKGLVDGTNYWQLIQRATKAIEFSVDRWSSGEMTRTSNNDFITWGSWNHIVSTWDGTNGATSIHLYVNGTEVTYASTVNTGDTPTTDESGNVYLGGSPGRYYDGIQSETSIWNRVLTAGEIAALYNSGSVVKYKPIQIPTPVLYLPMTDGTVGNSADYAFPTTGVLDNFDRADEDPLYYSGKWATGSDDDLKVVSNYCESGHSAGSSNSWTNSKFGPDSEAYVTVISKPDLTGDYIEVGIRLNGDAINGGSTEGYTARFIENTAGTDTVQIYRIDGVGGFTQLGATTNQEISTGKVIGISAIGNTITAYYDGSAVLSVSDSTYTRANYAGLRIYYTTGHSGIIKVNDFGGGSIISGIAQDWSANNNDGIGDYGAGASGLTWSADPANLTSPTFPTTRLLDNFNRANEHPVTGIWGAADTGAQIVSNVLTASVTGGDGATTSTSYTDVEAYATITALLNANADEFQISVRGDYTNGNFYGVIYVKNAGTDTIYLRETASWSDTNHVTVAQEVGVGDSIGISAIGSLITIYYKASGGSWSNIGSITDTTLTSGKTQLWINEASANSATVDDFGGGTYAPLSSAFGDAAAHLYFRNVTLENLTVK